MTNPTTPKKKPTKPATPTRPCPACATVVPAADINPSMVTAAVSDPEIDAMRLQRRARRSGDIEKGLRLRQVAGEVRDEAFEVEPHAGDDQCPTCRSERVAVNESKLSTLGKRMLARSRQQATEGAVDEIRERKSRKSRDELADGNRQRAVAREGLRKVHGGRWGA
ncbi:MULTISPECIES: hypothetical protein [Gordonia]|uniref:Uncharacterized protein n=1 Tax=Gordonia amicalis TaxID=89053 RepID=A0ABU4D9I8_9ACTN|nr:MULTISPECIES: hypothetical protein [Gordonia]MCZ4581810.1 hypothetical protein [Gordonia amicalis]MCZ4651126.1 hypothetical protein [Gordonia amicalis]MDJ0452144.1 hypothetical protein [Gordonia amicalis]MDV6305761.1 hypothetical protein [Gordonia amicalis]MDV7074757.1 hypothetical protein [Gordonia amicalis]